MTITELIEMLRKRVAVLDTEITETEATLAQLETL